MNSTQKNFRKQMKNAKKQGTLPDTYYSGRFRNVTFGEHKAGFSIAGLSLAGVLILGWNIFAVGTWVNGFFGGTIINSANNNKIAIHEYISNNAATKTCLSSSMQMVVDIYSEKGDYSSQSIRSQIETLSAYRNRIETDNENLSEIKSLYIKEFNTVESALVFAQNNSGSNITQDGTNYINSLVIQINQIVQEENNAYIRLFEKSGMKYSISEDGRISYEYTQ